MVDSQRDNDRSSVNRTVLQLGTLSRYLSNQDFGRVMQPMLACTFQALGFRVVENAVGVPDFTAAAPDGTAAGMVVAVEVKTSDTSKIALTERDLDGIRTPGQIGTLAVLEYPSLNPGWLLIGEHALTPRTWEMRRLRALPKVELGCDVDAMFHQLMSRLDTRDLDDGTIPEGWMNEQRRAFLAACSTPS